MGLRISQYCGDHATAVEVGSLCVWFSYETPIAFQEGAGQPVVASKNVWSNTTGKHLHAINFDQQIDAEAFKLQLQAVLDRHGL